MATEVQDEDMGNPSSHVGPQERKYRSNGILDIPAGEQAVDIS